MNSTLADLVHVIESAACGKNYQSIACSSQKPLLLKNSSFQIITQIILLCMNAWRRVLPQAVAMYLMIRF